jgi:multimeric flavodoxin WrbA
MKVIAFNGSPRKNYNTAIILKYVLKGAASQGADTELIHLYDYNYQGCISCFSCKLKNGKSYGNCAQNDELRPLLEKVQTADALILGSPIYIGSISGEMKSFLERLVFPYLVYDAGHSTLFPKKIPVGIVYTMGMDETQMKDAGYEQCFMGQEMVIRDIFGFLEPLYVNDTYQFDDYNKYDVTAFDVEAKIRRKREVFPEDCSRAFDMGVRLARYHKQ